MGHRFQEEIPASRRSVFFSQTNYEAWVANGGQEASLTSEADGFISVSATSGSYDFDDFVQSVAFSQGSSGLSLYTDELRFGTNLNDVVAIPEPSAFLMMFGGMSILALALRRRI
ncbi:PEP-CTERM sorting domain-containing protein [Kiritimatiellaeota bacterium B1221]|nr:PEP-CTERM sorting domain-containing protein [Kiritimatiellaeota bacterium B1221]